MVAAIDRVGSPISPASRIVWRFPPRFRGRRARSFGEAALRAAGRTLRSFSGVSVAHLQLCYLVLKCGGFGSNRRRSTLWATVFVNPGERLMVGGCGSRDLMTSSSAFLRAIHVSKKPAICRTPACDGQ